MNSERFHKQFRGHKSCGIFNSSQHFDELSHILGDRLPLLLQLLFGSNDILLPEGRDQKLPLKLPLVEMIALLLQGLHTGAVVLPVLLQHGLHQVHRPGKRIQDVGQHTCLQLLGASLLASGILRLVQLLVDLALLTTS